MVLGYFIFLFKSWDDFSLFLFLFLIIPRVSVANIFIEKLVKVL